MIEYYEEGRGPDCNYQLAVDVGCGSGQATIPLAEYFHHVIGCDISKDQLSNAPKDVDRVEFKVSPSENLAFLDNNSVDMLIAATSFHFFDQEMFYSEAIRILKPGGVLGIFSYARHVFENVEGQKIHDEIHKDMVEKYMPEFSNFDAMYRDYALPFPDWRGIFDDDSFDIRKQWGLSEFIGHQSSHSAWDMHIKTNPETNYLQELRKRYNN